MATLFDTDKESLLVLYQIPLIMSIPWKPRHVRAKSPIMTSRLVFIIMLNFFSKLRITGTSHQPTAVSLSTNMMPIANSIKTASKSVTTITCCSIVTVIIVFAFDFVNKIKELGWYANSNLPDLYVTQKHVSKAFYLHLKTIKAHYADVSKGQEKEGQKKKEERLRRGARHSRKLQGCAVPGSPFTAQITILEAMGSACCSSHESNDDSNSIQQPQAPPHLSLKKSTKMKNCSFGESVQSGVALHPARCCTASMNILKK
ncbi:hypothetical protein BD769DRAFT_1385581 [Suillus cothurnatus]|nr:hypothetical protein BD769DRAFT_1385581 [Suillus cothurnatus]